MRTIPKIETVETPEIGKYYLVPHVCCNIDLELYKRYEKEHKENKRKYPAQFPLYSYSKDEKHYHNNTYMPVIGVHHEDAKELNFPM